jgi:uncharacterized protein YxeA
MKKKLIIISIVVFIIICITALFLIFNKDTNKLKRYLKKDGYTCNSTTCTKIDKDVQYIISYKKGNYHYEDSDITIDINIDKAIVTQTKGVGEICNFTRNVKKLTTFTEEDTTNNCLIYLEKVNETVKDYQTLLVKSDTDIINLSK